MVDKYASWSELLKENQVGVDFLLHLDVRPDAWWLVAAPHGGGIEKGTTEIARAIAGADLTFYSVEGIRRTGNTDLHLTSHAFDEPRFRESAPRHERIIAIHGCDDDRPAGVLIWVGGADDALVKRAVRHFSAAGYWAQIDTFTPGAEASNLCNRGRAGGGIQLELPEAFRVQFFANLTRAGRQVVKPAFEQFTNMVRQLLEAA
jgi:phage replication-related protein YjqB (UPF0714/DUF867 family)